MYYPMLFRVFQHITSIVYRLWICIILCFSRFPAYHFNCVPAMSVCYPMLFRVFQHITSIVYRLWVCVILCFFAFSSISLQLCTGYECVLSYAFSRFPVYHFNCVPAMDMYYHLLFRVFQHITSIVYRLWVCVILCFFAFSSISLQLCTGYGYVLSSAFSRFPAYHFNCVPAMDMYYPMLFAFSSISLQLCTGYECVLSYAFSRFPAYHFNCVPAMDMCYPMLFRVFQHITSIVFRLWICVILCFFRVGYHICAKYVRWKE